MNQNQIWSTHSVIKSYNAYDGTVNIAELTKGFVQYFDLSKSGDLKTKFDWVLVLDVASYIPARYEKRFLENVFRHAGLGVVITWHSPHKIHEWVLTNQMVINPKEREKVIKIFGANGFVQQPLLEKRLTKGLDSANWEEEDLIAKSIFVFVKIPE